MKKIISIALIVSACSTKKDYEAFRQVQDNTIKEYIIEPTDNKKAMFVFPHPDDEIVCAGAMHQLKQQGWEIILITLTKGVEKEQREKEWKDAVKQMDIDVPVMFDLSNNTWDDVISDKIGFWYDQQDSLYRLIEQQMLKYNPEIVFTYDTLIGGYGHPEHRLSAKAVADVFNAHKSDTAFATKKILQITLPEKFEQLLLSGKESYTLAQKRTGNTGLPEPTVCFTIEKDWPFKYEAALKYTSQVATLKKFNQIPEENDKEKHFSVFNKEYYFEINR